MALYSLTNSFKSTITVFYDSVKLDHKGAILLGLPNGERTLFYDDFTSVEFQPNTLLRMGYIQFNVPGHKQNNAKNPALDEYSFAFKKNIELKAKRLYEQILENKKNYKSSNETVINQVSAADEVLKLKQLLDAGVLTQDEFDTKKKQLLGL